MVDDPFVYTVLLCHALVWAQCSHVFSHAFYTLSIKKAEESISKCTRRRWKVIRQCSGRLCSSFTSNWWLSCFFLTLCPTGMQSTGTKSVMEMRLVRGTFVSYFPAQPPKGVLSCCKFGPTTYFWENRFCISFGGLILCHHPCQPHTHTLRPFLPRWLVPSTATTIFHLRCSSDQNSFLMSSPCREKHSFFFFLQKSTT